MPVRNLPRPVSLPVEPFPQVSESCTSCVLLTARLAEAQEVWKRLAVLTPREKEVLHCVSRGLTNRQIARTLGIVEKTVKNHLYAIFAKIRVSDRTQAALFAINAAR